MNNSWVSGSGDWFESFPPICRSETLICLRRSNIEFVFPKRIYRHVIFDIFQRNIGKIVYCDYVLLKDFSKYQQVLEFYFPTWTCLHWQDGIKSGNKNNKNEDFTIIHIVIVKLLNNCFAKICIRKLTSRTVNKECEINHFLLKTWSTLN